MPNPTPARYTVQMGPTFTPEVAGELAAWAELLGVSASQVTRECAEEGLRRLQAKFAKRAGREMDGEVLARQVEAAEERGSRQVRTRRAYDKRTRGEVEARTDEAIADPSTLVRRARPARQDSIA